MKALVEEVNSVQKRIKVELSQEDVKNAFDSVYKRLKQKARIKGFRPGKAPLGVIKKFYGNSVAMDVADQLVKSHLFSAIQDQSIQPIAAPVLETMELPAEDKPYSFSALVDILPAIEIEGYKGLELSYDAIEVGESALNQELEVLQRRQGKTKEVEGDDVAAADGHLVTLSQTATLDGNDFPPFSFEKVPVELGKNNLLEEIETQVVGLKVGEGKTFDVKIPESFQDESLVGKTVSCTTTVEAIQEMIIPELNDDLAKDLGLEDFETLKKNISDSLQKQAEQGKRNQLEGSILEQLSEKNDFDVPPSMVDQVIDSMFEEMQFPSEEAKTAAKNDPEKRKELREPAKQRTKNTLILSEIIKAESIEVSDEDLDQHVRELVSSPGAAEQPDDNLIESIKKSMGNQARESLLFKKAIDLVLENASVTENKAK
ncbi:trigger factor [Pseudobacteriovorax antillogorgiicola]|uniref:Trigger factor n=1 Tax=Pseudobacteriovorax antillogorgiicola TaxID=1513793 RepID=A0A1Y6C5G9_9BACT|nr:trigger factor [Pseudobacteriovorax antillogorgiicola]TCS51156.1 trigger factor [Pseudobacteriovorax antillogorgiicola]SMF38171.1 trigger factor [Pseudobacteriovorax antillogorgiicola]